MVFSNLWQGRTGRLPYLVALVISSAAITVLPFIAGKITIASAGGMDPALSIVRMLLRPLLLGIGLLITGGPLVFFARRGRQTRHPPPRHRPVVCRRLSPPKHLPQPSRLACHASREILFCRTLSLRGQLVITLNSIFGGPVFGESAFETFECNAAVPHGKA